jgi:hypothetical protein
MPKTAAGVVFALFLLSVATSVAAQTVPSRSGSAHHSLMSIRTAVGPTPWAVVLCKFPDVDTPSPDPTFFEDLFMGAGKGGVFDYFSQISYGEMSIGGTVVFKAPDNSWFKLPKPWSDYRNEGPAGRLQSIVDCTKAAEASVDFSKFFGVVAVVNKDIDGGALSPRTLDLNGRARIFAMLNFPPFGWNVTFAAHEMGHGYGLPHSFGEGFVEYGDPYDPMSGVSGAYFFSHPRWAASGPSLNVGFKIQLGWIPKDLVFQYSSGDITVRLSPASKPETNQLLAVQIPMKDEPEGPIKEGHFYTVEYRTKFGWDRGLPGNAVLVREVFPDGRTVVEADITSSTSRIGQSFSDPHTGIYIDVNDMNDQFATVSLHNLPGLPDGFVCAPSVSCELSIDFYCRPALGGPISLQQRGSDGNWSTIYSLPSSRNRSNPVIDIVGSRGTTTYRVCAETERGSVCTAPMSATVPNGVCLSGSGENLTRCGALGLPPCRSDQP